MQKLFGYDNVFYDAASDYNIDQINEREYCRSLFRMLETGMAGNFSQFNFFLLFSHDKKVQPASADLAFEKKILFWFSEETGNFPAYLSKNYQVIFKSYITQEADNIFSNPLGYFNDFKIEEVYGGEKETVLFFSGNLNAYRKKIYDLFLFRKYRSLALLKIFPVSFSWLFFFKFGVRDLSVVKNKFKIYFSGGFKNGLKYSDYLKLLASAKFVLCPKGFESNETFRHLEALSKGCILVSGKMPAVSIYKDHPFIIYENFQQLSTILNSIVDGAYDVEKLLDAHRAFYHKRLSVNAIADRVTAICHNTFNISNK